MLSYTLAVLRPGYSPSVSLWSARWLSPLSAAEQAAEPAELLQRDSRAAATAVIAGSYNDAACQVQHRVANIDYKRLGMRNIYMRLPTVRLTSPRAIRASA